MCVHKVICSSYFAIMGCSSGEHSNEQQSTPHRTQDKEDPIAVHVSPTLLPTSQQALIHTKLLATTVVHVVVVSLYNPSYPLLHSCLSPARLHALHPSGERSYNSICAPSYSQALSCIHAWRIISSTSRVLFPCSLIFTSNTLRRKYPNPTKAAVGSADGLKKRASPLHILSLFICNKYSVHSYTLSVICVCTMGWYIGETWASQNGMQHALLLQRKHSHKHTE